jgi:hypothetical protein
LRGLIDDVCVTRDQFLQMIENSGGQQSSGGGSSGGVSEVFGCMDSTAENYNIDATQDDGSCTYSQAGGGDNSSGGGDVVPDPEPQPDPIPEPDPAPIE